MNVVRDASFQRLALHILQGPKYITPSPGSSHRSPSRKDGLLLSKSLGNESPSRFPKGSPMERDDRLQSLYYISSRVVNKEVPSPGSLHKISSERGAPLLEPLHPSLKIPGK